VWAPLWSHILYYISVSASFHFSIVCNDIDV
jgi:hypothetical protein